MIKDVTCDEAWSVLKNDKSTKLIDVRTEKEWLEYEPDLVSINKQLIKISWMFLVDDCMQPNIEFIKELMSNAINENGLFFICKSGVRSRAAAESASTAGFANCYNLLGGIMSHSTPGWLALGLPLRSEGN